MVSASQAWHTASRVRSSVRSGHLPSPSKPARGPHTSLMLSRVVVTALFAPSVEQGPCPGAETAAYLLLPSDPSGGA
jgi:hypothetical protein